jgi:nicotinamidase-related amidase
VQVTEDATQPLAPCIAAGTKGIRMHACMRWVARHAKRARGLVVVRTRVCTSGTEDDVHRYKTNKHHAWADWAMHRPMHSDLFITAEVHVMA